ncbi:protein RRP6-like 3 isoform X2 [Diospyros lotus]|uniref:protein RRP6-like 3 isoform X2 n=1 Tax=Diospyros lotus TaxID=55363 RepID=UPI00224F444E|nr:protein RRP6-like 3 isoform X2 [Diospyros lotus]
MESKEKIRIALTIACFAAISILFTARYRKHRKQRQQSQTTCYLKTETKPQSAFKRVLADNSYAPFRHLNSENDENSSVEHPYKAEIEALLKRARVEFDFVGDGNVDLKLSDSYVWIETESQLRELADLLSKERVFGVDTEQHSLRSFLGFTALIQISTQTEDYLVDTIALHDVMGILRSVFANPEICKVFHGADNDILWLQRDFHIYVVNLFDTAKACEVLLKPQKSLAYLLETYCGVATNKQLQREDWRQRPLPVEMVQYSQMDAHYLLYIAHCLASELLQLGSENSASADDKFRFVLEASRRSNAICLQLFSKEIEVSPGESAAASIISRNLNDQGGLSLRPCDTQDLVRCLCMWRDLMARIHDESLRYVLSDHAIIALAHKVPASETEIYDTISQADLNIDSPNIVSSLQSPSPVVCSHLEDFIYLFEDEVRNLEDIFQLILQNHLGPSGSCPLSVYSYALLSRTNLKLVNRLVSKQNGFRNAKQIGKKASRQLFVQKFSCKSPVYHNCRIYANDGRLLCYCDRRKLEWYLRRDLAKLLDENPPAIMLLFEPKGRPEDEDNNFYIQSKKNICVGCGEGNHYLRYRIIPSCYRVHFPEHMKSHRSHDIVLLCVDCHEIAHAAAEKYKRQVAAELGIPLFVRKVVDSRQDEDASESSVSLEEAGVSPLQLRTAAMALLRHGSKMPSQRREELMQIVMQYYGGREISEEDLERALLVGMSPNERRRLLKKKERAFKRSTRVIIPEEQETHDGVAMSATVDTSNLNDIGSLDAATGKPCSKEASELLGTNDADESSLSSCPDLSINGEILSADYKDINFDSRRISEIKHISNFDTVVDENGSPKPKTVNTVQSVSNGTITPKHNSKLSLLGHGPHGKQVVDHLLNEFGENGIRQFCQKWRQVFVEAIHPRFLPSGWDVNHSGRRDFGEFSVYNPAKKASANA